MDSCLSIGARRGLTCTARGVVLAAVRGVIVMSGAAVLAAVTLSVTPAFAEPVDSATRASARLIAEEGMRLYDKGECAGAVEKLTRAHDMVRVPTLALYAGKCLEKLGRLVDASEQYLAATKDEIEAGAPATVKQAQVDAEKARATLAARIPTIEVTLDASAAGATVALDGKTLPDAAIGVKRPIDPGHHVATFKRGEMTGSREFTVDEGDSGQVKLAFSATGKPAPEKPAEAPSGTGPGPWIVGGIGVAGLIVGAVTGALVLTNNSTVSADCNKGNGTTGTCTSQSGVSAANTVRTLGPVTTVALVAGGAGLVAGGIWLGVSRSSKSSARLGVGPVVGGAAWRLEGSW
jgi:hypothetical protein